MRQFYGRLEKRRSFCRKNHVHKIPRFLGGGLFWVLGGGGNADFIFMGARIFLSLVNLFLANLVRISGFSSLFLAIAVLSAHFARECSKHCDR